MHSNAEPSCLECARIFNRYTGFNEELRTWFEAIRVDHQDAHISWAGRGRIDQEYFFKKGASQAHYGESAHNANCAIDLFQQDQGGRYLLDAEWFKKVVEINIYSNLEWYGAPGAKFKELPHVQIKNWRDLVLLGRAQLVE